MYACVYRNEDKMKIGHIYLAGNVPLVFGTVSYGHKFGIVCVFMS